MCGIAGFQSIYKTVSSEFLNKMVQSIRHRGPDNYNIYMDEESNFGIGHARLSIIDLHMGSQPMWDNEKKLIITYNGELYNFMSLKDELEKVGAVFNTHSDTEVVLQAYKQWGIGCLSRFRGMFAFCIVDYLTNKFFLARDHFGIKPLYYYLKDGQFIFSSELSAIQAVLPDIEVDMSAIDEYLWLQYIPAPKTVYKDVYKILPGSCILLSFDHKSFDVKRHWNFNFNYRYDVPREEWIERLEDTINSSVKAHLVSDVPFGAFLSGGLDSTLVVNYMQRNLSRPVKTFSIGFEEDEYSELKYAEFVARKVGTDHYYEIIKPDALAILPDLVRHYGEPFGDSSAIPTYYVSRLARMHVPMVLSGDGGDEGFFGYQSYYNWIKYIDYQGVSQYKKPFHPVLSKLLPWKYPARKEYQGWMDMVRYLPYTNRRKLWKTEVLKRPTWKNDEFKNYFAEITTRSLISKAQYSDLKTYLSDDILTKVDRASMIHGLEVRTPLVDVEVWNLIAQIPPFENFNPLDLSGSKSMIKEILQQFFPDEFVFRKKQGFSIPINQWMNEKRMKEKINSLTDSNSNVLNLFSAKGLMEVLNQRNGNWIWLFLVLEEWLTQVKRKR